MAWRVVLKESFVRSFSKLDEKDKKVLRSKVKKLIEAIRYGSGIRRLDIKKLKGRWRGFFRMRVGKLRVIFRIDWDNRKIVLYDIVPRKKAYRG